jgi:hypothetical protein
MQSQILTGARALVQINGKAIGLFSNCSWSIRQDKVPQFILGRYNPAEITPTAQEAVTLTLTGYRVVNAGPYKIGSTGTNSDGSPSGGLATLLEDLLTEQDVTVVVVDRQTGKTIFTASGCRTTGWSSGVAAKGVSDLRLEMIGIVGYDESAPNGDNDTATAANLDDGT